MKRKSILVAGIFLTILYSLCVIASVALTAAAVVYFFVNNSIQLLNKIFLTAISPLTALGLDKIYILVVIGGLLVLSIFMLIAATRFIKHGTSSVESYSKRKGLLVFFTVFVFLVFVATCFVPVNNLLLIKFKVTNFVVISSNLYVNIAFGAVSFLHLISFVLLFHGLVKHKRVGAGASTSSDGGKKQKRRRNSVYTSGLDTDDEQFAKTTFVQVDQGSAPIKLESDSTKKLVEGIAKLDKMRKDGQIYAAEYTKLRGQMIKKYVK